MKKLILSLLLAPILLLSQPSFNVTDSNGETWNSEELLEQGKTIVIQFFSPGLNCWPSQNSLINLREAWYNTLCERDSLQFIQVAQWGSKAETLWYVNEYSNPTIPTVVGEWQGNNLTFEWMEWGLQWSYECWILRPDGTYEVDIPAMWDLEQTTLVDLLENDGFDINCHDNYYDFETNQTIGMTEYCCIEHHMPGHKPHGPMYDLQGRLIKEKPSCGYYIQLKTGYEKFYNCTK